MTADTNNDTKSRIFEAAESLMLERGFNGTGLNEMLKAVNVPKGSFYHWFPSKEQFGVELIEHYAAEALAYKRRWLAGSDMLPNVHDRFMAYFEGGITHMLEGRCATKCLFMKLSMEVSSWSDEMRAALQKGYDKISDLYETVIREGQAQGSINPKLDPKVAGALLQYLWAGAYQRATIARSIEPLRHVTNFAKTYLAT